jgi:hypothetical protein
MLRRVGLVRTDVSEECISSIIKVKLFSELATANVVPRSMILFTLMIESIRFSETSVLTRVTRRHIPEDDILQAME